MSKRKCRVEVKGDHLDKVSRSTPILAVSELIWNALDADATRVDVFIKECDLGIVEVVIRDNGDGIDYHQAEQLFSSLGGSWKSKKVTTPTGRYLHGQEGQGRFKSFAIGRIVDWTTTTALPNGQVGRYTITGRAERKDEFEISDQTLDNNATPGTEVRISELQKQFRSLAQSNLLPELQKTFAIYLTKYPKANIYLNGERLDPNQCIESRESRSLPEIQYEGTTYSYELEIIEWKIGSGSEVYLCNASGFPLQKVDKTIRGVSGFSYTAYLKSDHITKLSNQGTLALGEMLESVVATIDAASAEIKSYFFDRKLTQSSGRIKRWKDENVYPYTTPPTTPIDEAERKLFDILALNIADLLSDFERTDLKQKKFQFQLVKSLVEKNPTELQVIMGEVLNLSIEKQKELAELLQEASLSAVISASKMVSDRLKFIRGLEEILYNKEIRDHVKERSQLHRILAENTWVFGDAYSLTVNDESLKRVLEAHAKAIGINTIIDRPVLRIDGKIGIVDLMLSRGIPRNHANEREHLVVELKAPKVKVGEAEITQIKRYAYAVADDARFRNLETKWEFLVISSDIDSFAKMELRQANYRDGVIVKTDATSGFDITIRIKTWSELIQECKHRLEFVRAQLNIEIDSGEGLKFLKEKYAEYTADIVLDEHNSAGAATGA